MSDINSFFFPSQQKPFSIEDISLWLDGLDG
jgi:hypothetical protein